MRTRTILGLVACGLVAIGAAEAQQATKGAPKEARSTYTDAAFGYALQLPRFDPPPKGKQTHTPAIFTAPRENGFNSNVNITIHPMATSRKAFRDEALQQLKELGQIVKENRDVKVSGRDAIFLDFQGEFQGRTIHFLAVAVVDKARVVQVTCAATAEDYPKMEPEFRACLDSLKLPD